MALARTVDLTGIAVRPPKATAWLLRADALRGLLQAAGALVTPAWIGVAGSWPLEGAGALLGLPWGLGPTPPPLPTWLPWAFAAHGLLTALAALGCLKVSPRAMTWRRRLGYLAVLEVLLLGVGGKPRAFLVTLWTGVIFVALLRAGLVLSREVARVSGEEGLEVDPSRPRI
jgi:hypothetical protein